MTCISLDKASHTFLVTFKTLCLYSGLGIYHDYRFQASLPAGRGNAGEKNRFER